MNPSELYNSYARMESLPLDARIAAANAAKLRAESLASLDERASRTNKEADEVKAALQSDLRGEAQAASAVGAIPRSGAAGSGAQPNFAHVRSTRGRLDGLLKDHKQATVNLDRLQVEFVALEKQIADELLNKGLWAKAKAADAVTYAIAGATVMLSFACGPGRLSVGILAIGFAFVALRFVKGRSAMMMSAARMRPAVGSHPRVRLGYVLVRVGWVAIVSLILSLVFTAVAKASGLELSVGGLRRPGLDVSWFFGVIFGIAVAVTGARMQRASG